MNNKRLIDKASVLIKTIKKNTGLFADVGCALFAGNGKVYLGVCAAGGSNVICAEQIAIGSMITDGEYRIIKIVAVWKNNKNIKHIISPCGNCRQFIYETHEDNLETEIILDVDKTELLKDLLPYHNWWCKQDTN